MKSSAGSILGAVVLAIAALAGCARPASPADPGIVHVHALALDPADARGLYVATHTGLFHLDGDGRAQRVGDHYHDLMGFTVVSREDFIASGHPDPRSPELQAPGKPPLLGLVHSENGGADWQPVSLLGEVDFHSLEMTHGLVYGYDSTSGRFMVSTDRKTWETRAAGEFLDFAVSPGDPDLVVASTPAGLVRSTDGGRTWTPVSRAGYGYGYLDWAPTGLFGVAADGSVAVSQDAGTTWQQRGTIGGTPEALLADEDLLVAAATDRGIVESRDGGTTWTVRFATGAE